LLILIDLSIVIAAVTISFKSGNGVSPEDEITLYKLDIVALVFSSYFMAEISLRIFSQT